MNHDSEPGHDLVPTDLNLPATLAHQLPGIIARAGKTVTFAAEEFLFGRGRPIRLATLDKDMVRSLY